MREETGWERGMSHRERNCPSPAAGEERGAQERLPSLPIPAGSPQPHVGLVAQLSPRLWVPDPSRL